MISQPDKLFREKLEHFSKPAPAAAWNKIEAGLNKTNPKYLWMKIAAGLLLLCVATVILWPEQKTDQPAQLSEAKTSIKKQNQPAETKRLDIESKSQNAEVGKQKLEDGSQKLEVATKKYEADHKLDVVSLENSQSEIVKPEFEILNPEQAITENIFIEPEVSRTIVYSAEEVNAKFLKKSTVVEATSEEKKSSGIQKLMGLAYTIKNTETGLGDLRLKKDEILALNFRDKKQAQN